MTVTKYILIALIASVSIGEGLGKNIKFYACMKGQGKANVSVKTNKKGKIRHMSIVGRPKLGQPIEFDNFRIDKSKKCDELKGAFWNRKLLDESPYNDGYTLREKSLRWKVTGGNGYKQTNKGRALLYRQGNTVVACGKLTKSKRKCAKTNPPSMVPDDEPTNAPSPSPTNAPTGDPTSAPSPSPTDTPVGAPTGDPTPAPTPIPTGGGPTSVPTAAPVATTGTPTTSPVALNDGPTSAPSPSPTNAPTAAPTSAPSPSPTDTPTGDPTAAPTNAPSPSPTDTPTGDPTAAPTAPPVTR